MKTLSFKSVVGGGQHRTLSTPICVRHVPLSRCSRTPTLTRGSASGAETAEDLWQFPDRAGWYLPKFAADDQPDWNPASFVSSRQLAPGVKEVVLEIEISRERVPLRNAYKHVGQAAAVRVNGGVEQRAQPSSPPFPISLLRDGLLRVRGDMTAGETKIASEDGSVKAEVTLVVQEDAAQELYRSGAGDAFEVGPFVGNGMNLRGPLAGLFKFPTVIIFCEGPDGVAAARTLVSATTDVGGLSFDMRSDVRMYYRAPNEASLCYREEFSSWEAQYGVKVITSTRDSFQDMFDDDDTLMYEPESTGAILMTGAEAGDAEEAAVAVCVEAEISEVVRQSEEQPPPKYLMKGRDD